MFVYPSSQGVGDYTGLPKPSLSADVSNPYVLTHIQIQVKKNIQFCIIKLFCHCIATWYAGPPVSCKANGDTCRNQLGSWLDSDTITQKYITYLNKNVFKIKSVARALKYLRKSKGDLSNEQWFSSIAPLFKMGTSITGKNLLPLSGGQFFPLRAVLYGMVNTISTLSDFLGIYAFSRVYLRELVATLKVSKSMEIYKMACISLI